MDSDNDGESFVERNLSLMKERLARRLEKKRRKLEQEEDLEPLLDAQHDDHLQGELVLFRPQIFITGMSTSPSSRSRLFSHQSVVNDIFSVHTTRESLTSHCQDVQCLTEDLEGIFRGNTFRGITID